MEASCHGDWAAVRVPDSEGHDPANSDGIAERSAIRKVPQPHVKAAATDNNGTAV